jgi:translation initiation factor IF-2
MRRVYEVAKELGISAKALIKLLRKLNFDASSPMGPVTDEMLQACKEHFEKSKQKVKERDLVRKKFYKGPRRSMYERLKERRIKEKKKVKEKVKEMITRIEMGERKKRYKKEFKKEEIKDENIIKLDERVSIRELASLLRVDPLDLISKCLNLGLLVTINQRIDYDTAATIASEYGYETELVSEFKVVEEKEKKSKKFLPRPPVITVMGHVDHGKTTLLDRIRYTNVAEKEVGKITQHIGAYKVKVGESYITFIDTPGHHSFTAMRARGVQVTDIVLLLIAGDEGIKPQTIEAINHAKDAGVPIIVVINKIDLPLANPEEIENELMKYDIVVERLGGEVLCCRVSAKTGEGIKELLDSILTLSEILEMKAPIDVPAQGTIIESKIEKGKGVVATVIVKEGKFIPRLPILAGTTAGRIRNLYDEWGNSVKEALPGEPVQIVGFEELPQVGDIVREIADEKLAKEITREMKILKREEMAKMSKPLIETMEEKLRKSYKEGELKLIVKGDVSGSIEALSDALPHLSKEELNVKVIHQDVGEITESDVLLAAATGAQIIGFNTKISSRAREVAKLRNVIIRKYRIIYEALEDVDNIIKNLIPPKIEEITIGRVEVKQIFRIKDVGYVVGGYVLEGKVVRGKKVRVKRGDEIVYEGEIASVKRIQENVEEVKEGLECGIGFKESVKLEIGDIIEVYEVREIKKY